MKNMSMLVLLMLASCGGRVGNIVSETRNIDSILTCGHMAAEFENNLDTVKDIAKEKTAQEVNNLGLLIAMPLFLDLKNTERKEILALQKRNERLSMLLQEKNCAYTYRKSTSKAKIETDNN